MNSFSHVSSQRTVHVVWCAAARVFHVTVGGVTLHLPARVLLDLADALDELRAALPSGAWSALRSPAVDEI